MNEPEARWFAFGRHARVLLSAFVLRLASFFLTFTWIVNQVGFAFTRNSAVCYHLKNGFCSLYPLFLHTEIWRCLLYLWKMPVPNTPGHTAVRSETSGLWSVPAEPGCGSRKYLPCALIRWFCDVFICLWFHQQVWVMGSGMLPLITAFWLGYSLLRHGRKDVLHFITKTFIIVAPSWRQELSS